MSHGFDLNIMFVRDCDDSECTTAGLAPLYLPKDAALIRAAHATISHIDFAYQINIVPLPAVTDHPMSC